MSNRPKDRRAFHVPVWPGRARHSVLLALALTGGGLTALYFYAPYAHRFPAAFLSVFTFLAVITFLQATRQTGRSVISPLNWILLLFFLQLVVAPLLLWCFGPYQGTLPTLPSGRAINIALLVSSASIIAFAIGCWLSRSREFGARRLRPARAWHVSWAAILIFLVIGALGTVLTFRSLSAFLSYYTNPEAGPGAVTGHAEGSFIDTTALFLRPFLGIACVIAWCQWISNMGVVHDSRRVDAITLLAIAAVVVSYSTYSYNRAAFVAPIISMVAVYLSRFRQIRLHWILIALLALLVALSAFRAYRNIGLDLGDSDQERSRIEAILEDTDVNAELQLYTGAPQFLGFLLERTDYASEFYFGTTLVSSLLYPVPMVGEPFRAWSGVELYNRLIYGDTGIIDQIIPFQGELFINFHLPGVLLGYLLLGLAIVHAQRRFESAPTALQAFSWQYASVWLGFLVVGSVAVVSQIFIYFFWPLYVVWFASWVSSKRPNGIAAA